MAMLTKDTGKNWDVIYLYECNPQQNKKSQVQFNIVIPKHHKSSPSSMETVNRSQVAVEQQ